VCSCGICLAGTVDIQLFLERLQSVSVVDGAAHTQKDDVESNGGSLCNVVELHVWGECNVVELHVCRVRKEATTMGCKSPRSLHRNRKVPKWHPTTGTGSVLLA